ncbi:MAG TPA: tetratricopeptide repeat protein [Clostridiaceae bacterium]
MDYFEKAKDMYYTQDYKGALFLYQKALEERENITAALYNCGVCLIKLKDYKEAIPLFKSALIRRSDSKYYFNLAYCYAMLKDKKKALIYFNSSWALNHEDTDCDKAIKLLLENHK